MKRVPWYHLQKEKGNYEKEKISKQTNYMLVPRSLFSIKIKSNMTVK